MRGDRAGKLRADFLEHLLGRPYPLRFHPFDQLPALQAEDARRLMLVQAVRVDQRQDRPLPHALGERILGKAVVEDVGGQVERDFHFYQFFTVSLFLCFFLYFGGFTPRGRIGSFSALGREMSIVPSRASARSPRGFENRM